MVSVKKQHEQIMHGLWPLEVYIPVQQTGNDNAVGELLWLRKWGHERMRNANYPDSDGAKIGEGSGVFLEEAICLAGQMEFNR